MVEQSNMGGKICARGDARPRRHVVSLSIENFARWIHPGIRYRAPARRLNDREYQVMRDAAIKVIRKVGVETGGSTIQFALSPRTASDDNRENPPSFLAVGACSKRRFRRKDRREAAGGTHWMRFPTNHRKTRQLRADTTTAS